MCIRDRVTRAKAAFCHGIAMTLLSRSKGALSGYNRDSQWTKYAMIDLFDEVRWAPIVFTEVLASLKVNKDEMRARCTEDFITAVDIADYIAQEKNIPFRAAYKAVSEAILDSESASKKKGNCREISLDALNRRLMKLGRINPKLRKSEWALLSAAGAPQRLIERKKHIGAPAPEAAAKNHQTLQKNLRTKQIWYSHKVKQQEAVHKLLQEEIAKVIKK